jgi:hypothetical protein
MKPNEFFNSTENLNDLVHNNGLLQNPEGLLLYRKALGHSNEFDASIIYNTSQTILDPLGRPVRRTQVPENGEERLEPHEPGDHRVHAGAYPDPDETLVLAGEASLDATWPLTSPGVPSIRMLHNHFIVFDKGELRDAPIADAEQPQPDRWRPAFAVPGLHARMSIRPSSTNSTCTSCKPASPVPAASR